MNLQIHNGISDLTGVTDLAILQANYRHGPQIGQVIWHLIKHRSPYDPSVWAKAEEKHKPKKIKRLQPNATALGFTLLTTS